MEKKYNHELVEQEIQALAKNEKRFETDLKDSEKESYYLLFEFPYPSGDLHTGHWFAFAVTDIYARALRAQGKNVLFPIGFDAFGLPAENAAIKHGADPKMWTYQNMDRMRKQIENMGTSVDWSKEVITCDPSYYAWTQWLFTKLFEHGLAERKTASVKWDPIDKTVLANEQIIDGKSERSGAEVEERILTQWFLKITDYAERLIDDLDSLPWRKDIKEAQRQWIGKSEGAHLFFEISETNERVKVFTTRADTVYGATYLVLAPEHPLIDILPYTNKEEVEAYRTLTKLKSERERGENRQKTGVQLKGVKAVNPATKKEIPVWIADYVLASYGTGAVMAVPAHDERDFAFAQTYNLPVQEVVIKQVGKRHPEGVYRRVAVAIVYNDKNEILIQSQDRGEGAYYCLPGGGIDEGESPKDAALRETREETGYQYFDEIEPLGMVEANYHHPIKHIERQAEAYGFAVKLSDNSQTEPQFTEVEKKAVIKNFWTTTEKAKELLSGSHKGGDEDFVFLKRFLGEEEIFSNEGILINSGEFSGRNNREAMEEIISKVGGERAINYRIRDWLVSRQRYWGCPIPIVYDPEGKAHAIPKEHLPWLLPEDVDYAQNEGSPLQTSKELKERTVRIFGEGWTPEYDTLDTFVDSSWYFLRFLSPHNEHHFSDESLMKKWLPVNRYSGGSEHTTMHLLYARFFQKALYDLSLVPVSEPFDERFNRGLIIASDGRKMSKRWGNVVNPDEYVKTYGADAVRTYLAFIGPYNEPGHYPWTPSGVESMRKFLDRVYVLYEQVVDEPVPESITRLLAKTNKKVREDCDAFKFNTAISALMITLNALEEMRPRVPKMAFVHFLKLLSPFAPHLGEHLLRKMGVHEPIVWEKEDQKLLVDDELLVVVQINGKKKGEVLLGKDATEEEAKNAIISYLEGREVERVIYVPGRIINIVTNG